MFAREIFRWSADPPNTKLYMNNGRRNIKDLLGLSLWRAIAQLPEYKANDSEWTKNRSPGEGMVTFAISNFRSVTWLEVK